MKKDEKKPKPDDAGNAGKIAGQMMNIPFTKCTLFADQVHPFR